MYLILLSVFNDVIDSLSIFKLSLINIYGINSFNLFYYCIALILSYCCDDDNKSFK